MDAVISINTLAYEGYDLTTALHEIARLGPVHVELGFTRGYTDGLTEAHFSEKSAQKIGFQLSDLGLKSIVLSAHIDLTAQEAIDELKRRIDFGKMLGVRIVNTKVGPRSRIEYFYANIEKLARYAEETNIIIGLENPAEGTDQIITSGKSGARVVSQIGSDFVRLNYDFGNSVTYSKGSIDPALDYKEALPYACYLHLKDMKKTESGWDFSGIGEGQINYDKIFKELIQDKKLLPMSIEHLFMFEASEDYIVTRSRRTPDLDYIRRSLKDSINYVNKVIDRYS